MTISVDQGTVQAVPCITVHFRLPQEYGGDSVRVLVPTASLTGTFVPIHIFYALLEEMIALQARVGPQNSLVRVFIDNDGQPLPQSWSPSWHQLHSGFSLFITSLRQSGNGFPGLGQISGAFGVIEVTHARRSSGVILADYVVTLALNNGQRMSQSVPYSVAVLPTEWLLDWLEVKNEFSSRV